MTDLKQDSNGDIDLTGGDISYTESTEQHVRDILLGRIGDYRMHPAVGVGLEDWEDDDTDDLPRFITQQLAADGFTILELTDTAIRGHY